MVKSNEKLTSSVTTNNKLIADLIIEREKLTLNHENTLTELESTKTEAKVLDQSAFDAIKQVENLKGQLKVFTLYKTNETKRKVSRKQDDK